MKLKDYLLERYVNLFNDERNQYVDKVWNILQLSYKSIGGIKGSGFSSKESMLKFIPFWKLVRKNDKIIACILYKDKKGRKMIALGTDGSKEGKNAIKDIMKEELSTGRSYGEISHGVLKLVKRIFTQKELNLYLVPSEKAIDILGKSSKGAIPIDDYQYARQIADDVIIKVMYGKKGKKIERV